MAIPIRNYASIAAAAITVALAGCASTQLADRAAGMPVFVMQQEHPAVTQALGPLKTYVCLWSKNQSTIVEDAKNSLRDKAEAMGATALVDYQYQIMTASPRAQQCRQYLQANADAVILGKTGA